jgi:hypothetical protein
MIARCAANFSGRRPESLQGRLAWEHHDSARTARSSAESSRRPDLRREVFHSASRHVTTCPPQKETRTVPGLVTEMLPMVEGGRRDPAAKPRISVMEEYRIGGGLRSGRPGCPRQAQLGRWRQRRRREEAAAPRWYIRNRSSTSGLDFPGFQPRPSTSDTDVASRGTLGRTVSSLDVVGWNLVGVPALWRGKRFPPGATVVTDPRRQSPARSWKPSRAGTSARDSRRPTRRIGSLSA